MESYEKKMTEDWDKVLSQGYLDIQDLEGKNVLITGATGLIGATLIRFLNYCAKDLANPPKILACVRNIDKARGMFADIDEKVIKYLVGDIQNPLQIEEEVDYIVHAASNTGSKFFVEHPVETIQIALRGTGNMLELAREKQVKGFVYLSSMEVYGHPDSDEEIYEDHGTNLDTMETRSSYPEGKRMCEALCRAYYAEYGVPAKVLRLTQTFGPGVEYADNRVFAEFARCAMEKRNIVLKTKGETKRNYLYTVDAAAAILTLLLKGESGEAYNACNEESYCSIYEMAQLVAKRCAKGQIDVEICETDISKLGYAPVLKMNLKSGKLQKLGWKATVNLEGMFDRMIEAM